MDSNIVLYLSGFITGFILALPTTILALHIIFKDRKPKFNTNEPDVNDKDLYEKLVYDRLQRVKEISDRQGVLFIQATMPSKNAMHSKHQNRIVNEIKTLEKEKLELLTAILNDGYDPMVTMQDPHSGEVKQERLSAFMNEIPPDVVKENTTPNTKVTQRGKFKVYETIEDFDNDDDDDQDHTIH